MLACSALLPLLQGEIDADQLVAFLSAMGVELRGRWACCPCRLHCWLPAGWH